MIRHSTIPLARAWNTWSSRPAEMVFLPLGVRVTPVAYADSQRSATVFPAGDKVLFGRHGLDGSVVDLTLTHAGTRLDWSYRKTGPFGLVGSWSAGQLGEWGLRFWVNICLSSDEGHPVRYHPKNRAATVQVGHRVVAVVADVDPVQVTGHATVAAVVEEYETRGYFYLASQATEAPVLALRFNLEMMRNGRFAVAVADREDLAIASAQANLAETTEPALPGQTGAFPGALDAIRDVMAWNSLWDGVNNRPYTAISRNWDLGKFGGFGVWLNDQLYAALMTGLFDPEMARENLVTALASATPAGNFACLLTANDAWVDRTQLPIGAFIVWQMAARSGARSLLQLSFETLCRNHDWWWQNRDPQDRGLVSFGTSEVGNGLYKGTSFGARNESSMDNSPMHDEAAYDPETRTLASFDVGLNSLLALDAEMLSRIAVILGDTEAAERYAGIAEATRVKIQTELWDDSRRIFANRLWSGQFVRSLAPTSFYPLIAGAATPAQATRLLDALNDPTQFGGRYGLPGCTRDDPAYGDNTYWRGRIWPTLNYLVWHGLRRYGLNQQARDLTDMSFALFRQSWDERRLCPENFNAETGEPLDQPDTEGFYSWGALLPLMAVGEVMDVTPWDGWVLVNDGVPASLGPLESPIGPVTVTRDETTLRLWQGGRCLLATTLLGRLCHLAITETGLSMVLPGEIAAGASLTLPGIAGRRVIAAEIGRTPVAVSEVGGGIEIAGIPMAAAGQTLTVSLRPL